MLSAFYLDSNRIQQILAFHTEISYAELDGCTNKIECMKLLKSIYKHSIDEKLTNIDLFNLYDICYILCLEFSEYDDSLYRRTKASSFTESIKQNPCMMSELIDIYCTIA